MLPSAAAVCVLAPLGSMIAAAQQARDHQRAHARVVAVDVKKIRKELTYQDRGRQRTARACEEPVSDRLPAR